jgi:hypothetical protein
MRNTPRNEPRSTTRKTRDVRIYHPGEELWPKMSGLTRLDPRSREIVEVRERSMGGCILSGGAAISNGSASIIKPSASASAAMALASVTPCLQVIVTAAPPTVSSLAASSPKPLVPPMTIARCPEKASAVSLPSAECSRRYPTYLRRAHSSPAATRCDRHQTHLGTRV